jgi:hypothetical protein
MPNEIDVAAGRCGEVTCGQRRAGYSGQDDRVAIVSQDGAVVEVRARNVRPPDFYAGTSKVPYTEVFIVGTIAWRLELAIHR